MTYYLVKVVLSAFLIVLVSEVGKRSSFLGGLLASLPIISFLAIIWLYVDTRDANKASALARSVFWLVLPSLVFFLAFPWLVKIKLGFPLSVTLATTAMLLCYGLLLVILKKSGVCL